VIQIYVQKLNKKELNMKRSLTVKLALCLIVVVMVGFSGYLVAQPSFDEIVGKCYRYCAPEFGHDYELFNACLVGCVYGSLPPE